MEASLLYKYIYSEKNDSYVNINILNRSIKKPVQNKYGDFISDKPDKTMHGLGLKSIKSTIKKTAENFQLIIVLKIRSFMQL